MSITKLVQVYAYEVFISVHSIVLIKQGERCWEDTYSLSQDFELEFKLDLELGF